MCSPPAGESESPTSSPKTTSTPTTALSAAPSAVSPAPSLAASTPPESKPPTFGEISVEFTHEIADGMYGAIVKARQTEQPKTKGLPVIQPSTKAVLLSATQPRARAS